MQDRAQAAAASTSRASPIAPGARQVQVQADRRRQPSLINRRHAIIAGTVSLTTLASWWSLHASLPAPRVLPEQAPAITSAPVEEVSAAPAGATHTLERMAPQMLAAFSPTFVPGFEAQNQPANAACPKVAARLTVMPASGAAGAIRVHSGVYTSPWVKVASGPTSFAIPFPAPYVLGKGELVVEGDGRMGLLALTPGFNLDPSYGNYVRIPVVWDVETGCR